VRKRRKDDGWEVVALHEGSRDSRGHFVNKSREVDAQKMRTRCRQFWPKHMKSALRPITTAGLRLVKPDTTS